MDKIYEAYTNSAPQFKIDESAKGTENLLTWATPNDLDKKTEKQFNDIGDTLLSIKSKAKAISKGLGNATSPGFIHALKKDLRQLTDSL